MRLDEAKEILNNNGYLLEDRFDVEPITINYIDEDNYKDYIGKYVNVTGNVVLGELNLTKIPIKFGKVDGDFYCGYCKGLNSLSFSSIANTSLDNFFCIFSKG